MGASRAALILMKNSHFDRNLQYCWLLPLCRACVCSFQVRENGFYHKLDMPSQFSMRIFQFYMCLFSDLKSSERQNHNCFPLREMNDDHASFSRHTRRQISQRLVRRSRDYANLSTIGYINAIENKDVRTKPVGIILQLGMGFLVNFARLLTTQYH